MKGQRSDHTFLHEGIQIEDLRQVPTIGPIFKKNDCVFLVFLA